MSPAKIGTAKVKAYIRMLLPLHVLCMEGKEQSAEADKLRDSMDAPWYALSADEQDFAEMVSSDLFMLSGEFEAIEPYIDSKTAPRKAVAKFFAAKYSFLGYPDVAEMFEGFAEE